MRLIQRSGRMKFFFSYETKRSDKGSLKLAFAHKEWGRAKGGMRDTKISNSPIIFMLQWMPKIPSITLVFEDSQNPPNSMYTRQRLEITPKCIIALRDGIYILYALDFPPRSQRSRWIDRFLPIFFLHLLKPLLCSVADFQCSVTASVHRRKHRFESVESHLSFAGSAFRN